MSGFGACYDRWEFVITLFCAYLVVLIWDELTELSNIQKWAALGLFALMLLYGKIDDMLSDIQYRNTIWSLGVLVGAVIVFPPLCKKINKRWIAKACIFVIALITIYKNWNMIARDREISLVRQDEIVAEFTASDEDFYRVDYEKTFAEPRLGMNISFQQGWHGISEYVSIENYHYMTGFVDWQIDEGYNHNNKGLDQRTILETLSGVKYFIARGGHEFLVPYGFNEEEKTLDGNWILYRNQYALPLAYTYDSVLDAEQYQEMSGLEKMQTVVQTAVIDNYDGYVEKVQRIANNLSESSYTVKETTNAYVENNTIYAQPQAEVVLSIPFQENNEYYLVMEGGNPGRVYVSDEYFKFNPIINLGHVDQQKSKDIKICFSKEAVVDMNSIKIVAYNFDTYESYIDERKAGEIININRKQNSVTCRIEVDEPKIVCFSIPYSEGWSARVDGSTVNLYAMNSMLMGVELSEGQHEVELVYVTPGIRVGLILTIISIFGTVCYLIICNKKYREN